MTWIPRFPRGFLSLLAAGSCWACFASCDSGTEQHSGTGGELGIAGGAGVSGKAGASGWGGDPGVSTAGDTPADWSQLRSCSEVQSAFGAPEVLLAASAVSLSGRFVALGGNAALIETDGSGVDRYRIVLLSRTTESPGYTTQVMTLRWDEAQGNVAVYDVQGVSVGLVLPEFGGSPAVTVTAVALACDDIACTLLGAPTGETELVPLAGSELPAGFRPTGLAVDAYSSLACAYGEEGLFCHEGETWLNPLEDEPTPQFSQLSLLDLRGVAVTEAGELWVRRAERWTKEAPGFPGSVESVNLTIWGAAAIGANGELAVDFLSDVPDWHWLDTDASPRVVLATVSSWSDPALALVVYAEGTVLQQAFLMSGPDQWCMSGIISMDGLVGASSDPCGIATNQLLATESELIGLDGPPSCILVE